VSPPGAAKAIVEVTAGVLPGAAEPEMTRRWALTSQDWEGRGGTETLAEMNGKAMGYACLLMLQPNRVNWVRTDWIWL